MLKPYQALAAYNNLATITDRYTMHKVLSFMPCARKVRSAYIVCAHELTTLVTCCDTDWISSRQESLQMKRGLFLEEELVVVPVDAACDQ